MHSAYVAQRGADSRTKYGSKQKEIFQMVMKNKKARVICGYTQVGWMLVAGLVMSELRSVQAGWSANVNGAGYGYASGNVTAYSTKLTGSASNGNTTNPSAAAP